MKHIKFEKKEAYKIIFLPPIFNSSKLSFFCVVHTKQLTVMFRRANN